MATLNHERVALLIAALRSGEYTQGRGMLRDFGNRFCCMGVACDIYLKHNPEAPGWDEDNRSAFTDKNGHRRSYTMPDDVYVWFGFHNTNPVIVKEGTLAEHGNMGYLNDSARFSFQQIADILENFARTFIE